VTTNHVADLQVGQTQYAFILDLDGLPMDDVLLYRRGPERFMMVVNAANAGKIWAWLNAVNSRETVIDHEFPHRDIEGAATLRNLREPDAGDDQRVGMALQGPTSAEVLRRLRGESRTSGRLAGLPRFHFVEDEIAGIPALISRTGYTGERIAFELFVHPDHAGGLWTGILEAGESLHVKPAGLGARDSTRIEAGLPLYGHEIAGRHEIIPTGAGYGWAVRRHKPFFIGRERFVARERERTMEIVRFQLDETGSPAVRAGDLVTSHRGEYSGTVTSCALVSSRQLGLAYVDRRLAAPGTAVAILPLRGRPAAEASAGVRELRVGDRLLLSEKATVLPRFWRPGA
jgi:glycine hydroxymethyltransferase